MAAGAELVVAPLATGLVPWGLAGWLWYKRTWVPWLAPSGVLVAGLSCQCSAWCRLPSRPILTVADRYMYIAMLGPALALAWGLAQCHSGAGSPSAGVVVLGVLGIGSMWQTHYWHDTVSLFEHALTVNPRSSVAHNTLGMVRAAQNRLAEATRYYTEALRLWPRNTQAHNNLGNTLSRQGRRRKRSSSIWKRSASSPTSRKPIITWGLP